MNTTTEQSFTNDSFAAREAFAAAVNAGEITEVAGREVWARFRRPAFTFGTGSVSVTVRGRKARTEGTVWIKDGETVTFR